jgi:predicted ATPase
MCCGQAMAATLLPSWKTALRCERCGEQLMAQEFPSEAGDPFAADDPKDVLNEYQRARLLARWRHSRFGERYRRGVWSQCPIAETLRAWHQRSDCGLLMSGSMGTGKTVAMGLMMACLAARNEFSFCFWHASTLLTFLHNWRGWGEEFGEDSLLQELRSCRYLFLDDLGVEYNSPLAMTRFNEIIEMRYSRELIFVGTSNLSEDDLNAREGWNRIIDRIQENVLDWCEIGGPSKRRSTP